MGTNLGNLLLEERKKLGLKQSELAIKANISQSYVTKVEQGKLLPAPEKIIKLLECYSLSFNTLYDILFEYLNLLNLEDSERFRNLFIRSGVSDIFFKPLLEKINVYNTSTKYSIDALLQFSDSGVVIKNNFINIINKTCEQMRLSFLQTPFLNVINFLKLYEFKFDFLSLCILNEEIVNDVESSLPIELSSEYEATSDEVFDWEHNGGPSMEEFHNMREEQIQFVPIDDVMEKDVVNAANNLEGEKYYSALKGSFSYSGESFFYSDDMMYALFFAEGSISQLLQQLNSFSDPVVNELIKTIDLIKKHPDQRYADKSYKLIYDTILLVKEAMMRKS
ncbi:transcriptional regulator, XRE family [Denitrovibrio acetiphilus DSM 12809]|uniref:Transcriptional regulator, XRE family n=1 Tax=Denitrovibrio acetiphilus (strain DSM 12809 / NBRC 114555 / N2460) TaxID=522772 RepID=D4H4U5_DENA2|nr:helix-turn-helix transcriptional regulator [Denitrovibrio acetiphilus]ADD67489.1 transcriptional regulator, XRE family [Denitrovibrio acetiphilus DSM 12809]